MTTLTERFCIDKMYNHNMEAYIEYVILDNFFIDIFILIITLKLLRRDILVIRLIVASLIGTISAVLLPVSPNWLGVILRIITAPLMCGVFKHKSIKSYILFLLVMLIVTFAIGGMIIAIFNMKVADNYAYVIYPDKGIVGLSILAILSVWYVMTQLVKSLIYRKNDKCIYKAKIISKGVDMNLRAYIDTGLNLYDKSGKPIIVASSHLEDIIYSSSVGEKSIMTNTIDGEKETIYYIIEKFLIYYGGQVNTINNIGCIISKTKIKGSDLLIHSEMLKEGNYEGIFIKHT